MLPNLSAGPLGSIAFTVMGDIPSSEDPPSKDMPNPTSSATSSMTIVSGWVVTGRMGGRGVDRKDEVSDTEREYNTVTCLGQCEMVLVSWLKAKGYFIVISFNIVSNGLSY